jgi:dienelactone hydrolase
LTNHATIAALITVLLTGHAVECSAAESSRIVVEIENPVASPQPLQGYLRHPNSPGPLPAVVLLHSCHGNWGRLDERWGKQIASWGYVTLTVDSFGPRGIDRCGGKEDLNLDAYRALKFLVREPSVDPARIAVLGFALAGGRVVLMSVERGLIEQTSASKFRAAVAFYPPCLSFRGNVTIPTLILIGERDDVTPAGACRDMIDGREGYSVNRQPGEATAVRLIVYPGADHGFDEPGPASSGESRGHRLGFNETAADQSIAAVHEFLDATIGQKVQGK